MKMNLRDKRLLNYKLNQKNKKIIIQVNKRKFKD